MEEMQGNLSNKEVEEEKKRVEALMKASDDIVDQVVNMTHLEICEKLESIGIKETNRIAFRELAEESVFTPQPIVEHWIKQVEKETGLLEKVFLEACAARLWQLWLKDRPLDRSLHFLYQSGYQAQTDEKLDRAEQAWKKLWEALETRGYINVKDLPDALALSEPQGVSLQLKDWVSDFKKLTSKVEKQNLM